MVGDIREGTPGGGNSGPDRPPFCPPGGVVGDADLIEVTGGYSGDTGMVPVQATMHVDRDGFVQLCARVVDDRCEGGEVVRGVDGVGLMVNVTRFDWVSGYEEPQVWLVQINDGVIDNPAGFGGMRAS